MDKQKVNKYLTEKLFNACWYECDAGKFNYHLPTNKDFFTNADCMTLWLKIQEMDWFMTFEEQYWCFCGCLDYDIIHPDRLAPAVYEFMKGLTHE